MGLPPPSPSRPHITRFGRPNNSLDLTSKTPPAPLLASHDAALMRSERATSVPASSPTSASGAPLAPRHTLSGNALNSSMRISAAAPHVLPASAPGAPSQGLSGMNPARPATATGVGSTGSWVMELGDGGASPARVSNKAAAEGSHAGLTPTLHQQQQQQLLLNTQRHSGSSGSSSAAGSHTLRTAWDVSGSSVRPGLGAVHASLNQDDRPSSPTIGSPTLSWNSAAAAAAAAAAEGVLHPVGSVTPGRTMPTSAAASPSRLGSSSSIPLPTAFESSRSSLGTLTGMNASKLTSNFALAFGAESQAEMDGLALSGMVIGASGRAGGGLSQHDSGGGFAGNHSNHSSGSHAAAAQQVTGEEPMSPSAGYCHTGSFSMQLPSWQSPTCSRMASSRSLDQRPSLAQQQQQQQQGVGPSRVASPSSSSSNLVQRAHSSASGATAVLGSSTCSSGGTGVGGAGVLSGSALAAQRALKGPTHPPASPLLSTIQGVVGVGCERGEAEGAGAGTGQLSYGLGSTAAPSSRHHHTGSWGHGESHRGPSLLRRNSQAQMSDAMLNNAAAAAFGSGRLMHAVGTPEQRGSLLDTQPLVQHQQQHLHQQQPQPQQQQQQQLLLSKEVAGAGADRACRVTDRAPSAPLAQICSPDTAGHKALGISAISSSSLSSQHQQQQEREQQQQQQQQQQLHHHQQVREVKDRGQQEQLQMLQRAAPAVSVSKPSSATVQPAAHAHVVHARPSTSAAAEVAAASKAGASAPAPAATSAPTMAAAATTAAASAAVHQLSPASAFASPAAQGRQQQGQQQQQQQQQHSLTPNSSSPGAPTAAAGAAVTPFSAFSPCDYGALLGCEINEEHSAALPGYTVGKVIGEGGFCQVRLAVHHLSKRKVAIKVINKSKLTDVNEAKRIQREIRVMLHLTHECIIKLFEVVDSADTLYLVMEHAPNQSLLDYVRARKRLVEGKAAIFLKQIVAGLQYCHSREVVHRDVKLENILLGADGNMKIIDFGLSAFFVPGKRLRVHCGSPSYAAPEIVSRKHYDGPPVDVWSLGVVLFACLAGHLPFHSSSGNKQELCQKIIDGKFSMPAYLSPAAKDLLTRMLTVDPDKRATFEQVLAHPWVTAVAAWAPQGGSVYALTGGPDERVVAQLEMAGYERQQILQTLQARTPNYLTTSYYMLAEAKAERSRAAAQQAGLLQRQCQQQQEVPAGQSSCETAAACELQSRPMTAAT
ncbi:hypothetical protein DUNSADRAFT_18019 [Dunaliella salina]|uniref:Uncharacterized protein n=1 Tax=Dunaliella salina TaxID=3046 RepID=A0ABQ7G0U6_DUNSA|nr:hypothetical protein DUNSADRAFT_18019 [Dunaliella salina]|eukprot:KAF5828215.1 hypothetical protein DUNSADRAFT_18019 [Dunaliella salina]